MLSIESTIVIDLLNTLWIVLIFVAVFCLLPAKSSAWGLRLAETKGDLERDNLLEEGDRSNFSASFTVGYYLRFTAIIIVGVLGLNYLHLLNWLTLILLYGICLVVNYLESSKWQWQSSQKLLQTKLFNLVDTLDSGLYLKQLAKTSIYKLQNFNRQFINHLNNFIQRQGIAFTVLFAVILSLAFLLRWEYPLMELRYSHPDSYSNLLIAQQIITGNYPGNALPVLPALTAALSILGSIEPMQTLRFLSPILGIVTVLSVGYCVGVLNKNAGSALVAMFALGIYLFTSSTVVDPQLPSWIANIIDSLNYSLVRQWTGSELEIGTIALLLGLGYFFDCPNQRNLTYKINLACSLILLAIAAPPLLILAAIAPIGILGGKKLALFAVATAWVILAIFAAMTAGEPVWLQSFLTTLPIPLSLLAGFLFNAIAEAGQVISAKWSETFFLALVLALSCNFLLPSVPKLTYVEYDIAARKTLEIKNLMPRNTWTIAAPTEQLAEIYGSGWYEDLATFVEKYQDRVKDPQFSFPLGNTDLFVFVEKVPFVTFANEPDVLPNSILSDRTFRHYRSTAGRSSLEFEALQLCEAYRQNHADSKIYYENEQLRIYQFKVENSV